MDCLGKRKWEEAIAINMNELFRKEEMGRGNCHKHTLNFHLKKVESYQFRLNVPKPKYNF